MVFIGDTPGLSTCLPKPAGSTKRSSIARKPIPQFAKVAEKAVTRVRAHLVGLLRKAAKYEEAMKQVDLLLKDHGNALELLMEKGMILQDWSETEPAISLRPSTIGSCCGRGYRPFLRSRPNTTM